MSDKIVLNSFGETLIPYPGNEDNPEDEEELELCVGIHDICDGWVDVRDVSDSHNVLYCRACGLRIYLCKDIKTWKDLRVELEGER